MSEFQVRKDNFASYRVVDVPRAASDVKLADGDIRVKIELFGYFPTATHLDMTPTRITEQRIVDGAVHRAELPPAYNIYSRVTAEPGYDLATDNERMLLWPLHITSFCLWDALQDSDWYGAQQVVIVSASSKTSIGLAYALGLYEQCVTYEALTEIDATIPTVIVDMSGNSEVLGRLHTHLGDNMRRCINVGLTHWGEAGAGSGIIEERSEFFFAPSHIQKRLQDWGPDGFAQRTSSFMQDTAAKSLAWLKLRNIGGLQGLADIYEDVCEGRIAADQGLIIEL